MKTKTIDIDTLIAAAVPARPNPQLQFTVPIRVVSEANLREHWLTRHKRKKNQQEALRAYWPRDASGKLRIGTVPCVVRLTRLGPRPLDSDNLAGSFKHVQDQIAREIGVDDGSEWVKWEYAQVPVGTRVYALRIEIY